MDFKENSPTEDVPLKEFKDIFTNRLSPSITGDKRKLFEERLGGNNAVITVGPMLEDSFAILKGKLDSRDIKLGDIIGVGTRGGIVFELLDKNNNDKIIDSAVLRIDFDSSVVISEKPNPARVRPILKETWGQLAATIVPRAKEAEFTDKEFIDALAVINEDKQLPGLMDIESAQFLKIEGISVPVLTDLSSAGNHPERYKGLVEAFLALKGMKTGVLESVPPEKMAQYRQEQEAVHNKAVAELTAAGINLGPVPTKQTGAVLSPLEQIAKVQER